jgi:hypothetical protein
VSSAAQQAPDSSPASKEDIDKVFHALHLRDTMKMMMDVTAKQQRQLMHEQLKKSMSTAALPPDFEARMDKMMDDTLKNFPMEEMLQVMAPVYQKHLSKGDADAMVAFYSTATGAEVDPRVACNHARGYAGSLSHSAKANGCDNGASKTRSRGADQGE